MGKKRQAEDSISDCEDYSAWVRKKLDDFIAQGRHLEFKRCDYRTRADRVPRQLEAWSVQYDTLVIKYLEYEVHRPVPIEPIPNDNSECCEFNVYNFSEQGILKVPGKESPNYALMERGYLGNAPWSPSMGIHVDVLKFYKSASALCPSLGIQTFAKALFDLHGVPFRIPFSTQFTRTYEAYQEICRRVDDSDENTTTVENQGPDESTESSRELKRLQAEIVRLNGIIQTQEELIKYIKRSRRGRRGKKCEGSEDEISGIDSDDVRIDRIQLDAWREQCNILVTKYRDYKARGPIPIEAAADDTPGYIEIQVFNFCKQKIINIPNTENTNCVLIQRGYLGNAPSAPSIAIHLDVLRFYKLARIRCPQLKMKAFTEAFCDLHMVPFQPFFRAQFSTTYQAYKRICRRVDGPSVTQTKKRKQPSNKNDGRKRRRTSDESDSSDGS